MDFLSAEAAMNEESSQLYVFPIQVSEKKMLKELEKTAAHPLGQTLLRSGGEPFESESLLSQRKAEYKQVLDEQVRLTKLCSHRT